MRIQIVNDTGNVHFGCALVMETLRHEIKSRGHCIVNHIPHLVIVNGEGTLHRDRGCEMLEIAKNYPSILINSVWQDNSYWRILEEFKFISVRESISAEEMRVQSGGALDPVVIPDLIFASHFLQKFKHEPRFDKTGVTDDVRTTNRYVGDLGAMQPVEQFLGTLTGYPWVATGRFHAACACAVLGIPFSTWQSNTHKIDGLMRDMDAFHNHFGNREEAIMNCPGAFDPCITEYVDTARKDIATLFDSLENFV